MNDLDDLIRELTDLLLRIAILGGYVLVITLFVHILK
jgi:hypothetical protein